MSDAAASLDRAGDAEALVRAFIADLGAGRGAAAKARLGPDYALEVAGEGSWPLGGEHRGERLSALMRTVRHRFPDGLALTVGEVTARDDRVVVEAQSEGVRCDGRPYRNDYVFIFIVRDGLIRRQREFCDIIAAGEALCGPLATDESTNDRTNETGAARETRPEKGMRGQDN